MIKTKQFLKSVRFEKKLYFLIKNYFYNENLQTIFLIILFQSREKIRLFLSVRKIFLNSILKSYRLGESGVNRPHGSFSESVKL